jgi:hypothetical protein
MFQRNQQPKAGTITKLKLSSGQTLTVKTLNPLQYAKLATGFPERPWMESEEAQQGYERWMRKMLPFITGTIDQDALAQRRAEMEALEMPLPADDKLAWVAYGCIDDMTDLQRIVEALTPRVK